MKAATSGEASAKPAPPSTEADAAFTLGASVLVGGVKPGRLRYIGGEKHHSLRRGSRTAVDR